MDNTARPDVMLAVMKLMRAMRRHPPHGGGLPPGRGRLLEILAKNDGVSSRELAELMDIRPSSLTEMLVRMEREGLITRTTDENDRRVTRISMTESCAELAKQHCERRAEDIARVSACFTDEEAAQFCSMCDRLREHLEQLAETERAEHPEHGHRFGPMHHRHGHCGFGPHGDFPPPPPHDDFFGED